MALYIDIYKLHMCWFQFPEPTHMEFFFCTQTPRHLLFSDPASTSYNVGEGVQMKAIICRVRLGFRDGKNVK